MTEQEVSSLLRISPRSLRKARQSGAIRYVSLGRLVRYLPDHVTEYVECSTVANDRADAPATRGVRSVRGGGQTIQGFLERARSVSR